MHCPDCNHENTALANFCSHCGRKLRTTAARPDHVSEPLPDSSDRPLPGSAEGELRIVTVLFADMTSSVKALQSLHAEAAADRVSNLLAAMADAVIQHEGSVDRFLGDGLLALFGAPRARESDPERAILAAMEIRRAAGELGIEVHAGINTGEVYVGDVGSQQHHELTVMGPAVSLASRFQDAAAAGQILVGEATFRLTRRSFGFSPLALSVPGIDHPLTAYAVERALPRFEKVRGIEGLRAELIGRDDEFAQLKAALQAVYEGQGQMVSLLGEAGLGKSRLVAELKAVVDGEWSAGSDPADASPPLWLEGRCLELSAGTSYGLFLDLLREYFGWRTEESDAEREARIAASLRELVDRGALPEEHAQDIAPLLGILFSLRSEGGGSERLKNAGPEQIKNQTFLAIRDFFVAMARRQPVVLVCEDLHWADSLSLELISLLMEVLAQAPLLLLCIYRPEQQHPCRELESRAAQKCPERYTRLHLRELTIPQSRRLVESLLVVEDFPSSVKELILERSRGNPFYLEEIIRSLIDAGMIYREEGESLSPRGAPSGEPAEARETQVPDSSATAPMVWRARPGIDEIAVPESVQSVILSRVDRLAPDLKEVLQSAAVIGRLFRRPLLESVLARQEVLGCPISGELDRALWELEEYWLIQRERVLPEEEYSFRHGLIQETVYAGVLRRHRAALHQRIGQAIEERYQANLHEYYEQLAHHYKVAGSNEKALEYLLKAGEKARQSYLNTAAVQYFEQALERLEPGGTLPSGTPEGAAGDLPKQQRLTALTGLGQVHVGTGNVAEAERCFREAIAVAHELRRPTRELVRLYYRLGDVLYWQNQWDELIRIGEEGLALLGEDRRSVEAAMMNHIAAVGYSRRDLKRQYDLNDQNARFLLDLPYSEELRPIFVTVALGYFFSDKSAEKVSEWLEALEQRAEEHGDVRGLMEAHHYRGRLLLAQGDLQAAARTEQRGCELARKIGDVKTEAWCLGVAGQALLLLGDLPRAETFSREALEIMVGDESDIASTLIAIGTTVLCRGAWDEAAAAFERAIRLFQGAGYIAAAWAACALGQIDLARGEPQAAAQRFEEATAMARRDAFGLAAALAGLEVADDDPRRFRAFCRRFQRDHPQVRDLPFTHWLLDPAETTGLPETPHLDEFTDALSAHWTWQDPFGDCSFSVRNGLEIDAANGRDLSGHNRSAPRLLRPMTGDFVFEAVCAPVVGNRLALGGILVWQDSQNFLRLDRGTRGKHELCFMGCLGNQDVVIGRGRLDSEQVVLRLERRGGQVRSLCSADGRSWFTLGEVAFPEGDPVDVGLYAIGSIDRTLYRGAYVEGASIRFESFRLWT